MSTEANAETQIPDDLTEGRRPLLGARYELLGLLGVGGMGSVYKAHDRELDELVAVKVLRPEIAGAPGVLDRFRRELKLARRVTHPNVARVFDIGEHGGDRILTMELVVGESLAALLERERVVSTARVVEIARCICAGVEAAHQASVIHRDLKPDNVLLGTDGRVLVADFGIARALEPGEAGLTAAGFVGTPAYIAPEQVESPSGVDHRADIYALGEILYEMITGELAWRGDSIFAIVARRLSSPPPDARDTRPDADPMLAEIALRCMARRPDERFASMEDVGVALGSVPLATSTVPPTQVRRAADVLPAQPSASHKRVAVLPFRNAGPESDGYLADSLTEDLIDLLTAAKGLRVTSRGVVMRHKGSDHDPREVGRELDVSVVVEGSVRRAPGAIRINARVVSVDDGFQLWAQRFDGVEADMLTLNEEVAKAVGAALTVDIASHARGAVEDPEALDLYLRARSAYLGYYGDGRDIARTLFEQALARSPDDPRVIAGYVMTQAYFTSDAAGAEALRREAERAMALAPSLPDVHVALGALAFQQNDVVNAVRRLVRALKLAANHAEAHDILGRILAEAGAPEGLGHLEAAMALEPGLGLSRAALARYYLLQGDRERAEAILDGMSDKRALPGLQSRFALWFRDVEKARELLEHVPAGSTGVNGDIRKLLLAIVDGADISLSSLVAVGRGPARARAFGAQVEAEIGGLQGNPERSLRALERADAEGLYDLAWLDRCPVLEPIRGRPELDRVRVSIAERASSARAAYAAEALASSG